MKTEPIKKPDMPPELTEAEWNEFFSYTKKQTIETIERPTRHLYLYNDTGGRILIDEQSIEDFFGRT